MVNVVSGDTDEDLKQYKNENWSGRYQMVDMINNRPAYKVSFIVNKDNLT